MATPAQQVLEEMSASASSVFSLMSAGEDGAATSCEPALASTGLGGTLAKSLPGFLTLAQGPPVEDGINVRRRGPIPPNRPSLGTGYSCHSCDTPMIPWARPVLPPTAAVSGAARTVQGFTGGNPVLLTDSPLVPPVDQRPLVDDTNGLIGLVAVDDDSASGFRSDAAVTGALVTVTAAAEGSQGSPECDCVRNAAAACTCDRDDGHFKKVVTPLRASASRRLASRRDF